MSEVVSAAPAADDGSADVSALRLLGRVARRALTADVLVLAVVACSFIGHGSWVLGLSATVAASLWLGASLPAALGAQTANAPARVVVAFGVGLPALMVLWLPANVLCAALDAPQLVWRAALAVSLAAAAFPLSRRMRRGGVSVWSWLDVPVDVQSLILVAVPAVFSVSAAVLLTGRSDAALAYAAPLFAALLAVLSFFLARERFPLLLFSLFFSLLLLTTFRSPHLFGFDIQQEFGVATMRGPWWPRSGADPYEAMLSITLLPRSLHAAFGLSPLLFFKVLAPAALALAAVGCFRLCCLWASDAVAAVTVAVLMVFTPTFQIQLPAIARQELAFLVLTAAMVVGHSNDIAIRRRRALFSALLSSLGFIHYTTSYVVVVMLLLSFALSVFLRDNRHLFMVSARSLLAVVVVVAGWNFAVTDSGGGLTRSFSELRSDGADLLPSGGNFLQAWIAGTSTRPLSAAEYSAAMSARVEPGGDLSWMTASRFADQFPLQDATSPSLSGVVPAATPAWRLVTVAFSQSVLVASLVLTGISLRASLRRRDPFLMLLAGFVAGSVLFSAVLRLSGSASALYNPERQALLTALFTSPLVAASLEWGWHRRLVRAAAFGALSVAVLLSSGLSTVLFGGAPSPVHSSGGESVERFTVRAEDVAAADWLNEVPPAGGLVQTDRYGQLSLLTVGDRRFSWVPVVAPVALDQNAYVLQSSANRDFGRARGDSAGALTVFVFPEAFLDATRSPVYVNGRVTVWK